MEPNGQGKVMCFYSACAILHELQIQSVNEVVRWESVESRITATLISFPFLFYFNTFTCRPVARPLPRDRRLYSGPQTTTEESCFLRGPLSNI
jgi:hypothetical protein